MENEVKSGPENDSDKTFFDKLKEAWSKSYRVSNYEAVPKVVFEKASSVITNPAKFYTVDHAKLNDSEIVLGFGFSIVLSALLAALATLSILPLFSIPVFGILGVIIGAGYSKLILHIFKKEQINFEVLVRVYASGMILLLPPQALVGVFPGGIGYVVGLIVLVIVMRAVWFYLTRFLNLSEKQAAITIGVPALLFILLSLMPLLILKATLAGVR